MSDPLSEASDASDYSNDDFEEDISHSPSSLEGKWTFFSHSRRASEITKGLAKRHDDRPELSFDKADSVLAKENCFG
jgi:hypothetical protein